MLAIATALGLAAAVAAVPLPPPTAPRTALPVPTSSHVLVVGLDGFAGRLIQSEDDVREAAPTLAALIDNGCFQDTARTGMQTSSKPGWANFFMGAGPDKTTVTSNGWERPAGFFWADMFWAAHEAGLETVLFTDHEIVNNLPDNATVGVFEYDKNHKRLTESLIDLLLGAGNVPELVYLHYDQVDAGGHAGGWGSRIYFAQMSGNDGDVARVLDAYASRGIDPLVIFAGDHGGSGRGHGSTDERDFGTSLCVSGPLVRSDCRLSPMRSNIDVPVIALEALGVPIPDMMTGMSPTAELYDVADAALAELRVSNDADTRAQAPRLAVAHAAGFNASWSDHGSRATEDVAFWNAVAGNDEALLGSVWVPDAPELVVNTALSEAGAFAHPTGFRLVWDDQGSGADLDGSIFALECPAGFVALGEAVVIGRVAPEPTLFVCVAEACATPCVVDGKPWSDQQSQARVDVSIWSYSGRFATATVVESNRVFARTETEFGMSAYDLPDRETKLFCLKEACLA